MAALMNGNTKRYSWWWDSHISPKNSKWLQENLTDMDSKVKQMIKVIEEDADSFARRAEMYYKKRPELMKLVEEFYRAYRALAERYDHATGVIRHAQQTMAEAFPNQDPMMFGEDSPVGSSTTEEFDPQTPESYPPIRAPVYPSDLQKGALGISSSQMSTVKRNIAFMEDPQGMSNGKGLKIGKARKGLNFNDAKVLSESERASKAEAEIVALKDALAKVQAEKDANLAQFDKNLERLANMESEVSRAQEDSRCLNERATRAEAEVETLRETLSKLEVEKESSLLQYQQCLENIADLEERVSLAQKEAGEVNERASQAEAEIINLKQSLVGSETDKEAALVQYQQCLETISDLEERLRKAEEDAMLMNQRAENADGEVESLKEKVSRLTHENEAYELRYQQCLETIADLKLKLFHAQEETQRLSREIEDGVAKLKFAEEKCVVLERSNQNLHSELDGLLEKLGNQSHELTEKQKEMGKLWTTVQEEHLRFMEAETAFQTLQQLHSQSQEELNTLALELQNRSQILKDMEARNSGLLKEVQEAKDENKSLDELNLASAASIKSLQEEVSRLRETIQKLEAEVELRVDQRNALQQEIYCLKEELNQMGKKHQSMVEQVAMVGLHPEDFGSSIKELQEENSNLKEIKERESIEKTALLEKLELMEKLVEKNLLLENSISDLNSELETIRGKLKTLEEACMSLAEEKSGLHSEKNMLISRLESATENSKKLCEENRLLENSLFDANAELEELKSKLKSLEDSCHTLNDDKSSLVNERESLLSHMDIMRKTIEDLEREQAELKVKVLELATERESCLQKINELGVSLDAKDRDYASFVELSESQKSKIHHLQDENQRQEREYQEELDRAHDAHVEIIVLQKCLQDWLEKSSSLVAENQNLKQAAHLLEKLVSELEEENIGKQVQIDSSVTCIKVLRTGICQVLMKLEVTPGIDSGDENSQDQKNIHEILSRLDEMQTMLLKIQNENQQSTIESLVLVEFVRQLKSEAVGIATGKNLLEKENESQRSQLLLLEDEIQKLICMNGELTTKVNQGVDREEVLKVKIDNVHRQSAIQNLVLVESLKQLNSEASGIATEKRLLEEELESKSYQLSFLRDEAKNLSHMIEELTTKVNQGFNREEVLKVEVDDLHMQSAIESLVLAEFLQQIKSEAAGIATEKSALEEELESHRDQLSFSLDETQKLSHMIEELTTEVNQGVSREELLKLEIEDLHMRSSIENLVLVEFLQQLKSEAVGIATEKNNLEEELESQCYQLSSARDETKNLVNMIGELTTKVNEGVNREEVLKVENEDLLMQSAIENLVLVELLQQIKSEAVGIATELESQRYQLLFSQDETKKLTYMIGELTTRVNQGLNREEVLKVKVDDLHMQSAIENLVCVESLRQLQSEAASIATEKQALEEELESKSHQLSLSRDEIKNLSYMIGELTTKVNQGVNREQVLKVENEDLHMQYGIENLVLIEYLRQLKSEAAGIATEKQALEEELESQCCQLSSSLDETKNLSHTIEELTTKINQGVNREEVLKVENEDLQRQSAIENLVLTEFFKLFKFEAAGIAKTLEDELESLRVKLSFSRDETQKLIYMNGELTTKVNQGVNREEVLNVEIEDLHRQVLQLRNDYTLLQEENYKTLDEKRYLTKSTLRLEEEKRELEEDISLLLSENIYQSSLIILLEDVVLEKLLEAVKLNVDLERLSFVKCNLEEEVKEVSDKLKSTEIKTLQLEGLLEKTDAELLSARSANDQLEHEIANVKDQLVQKEKELVEAMMMISIVQNEKSELSKAVEDLECRYKETKAIEEDKDKQVLKLQGEYEEQVKKTGHANEANMKLEADLLNLLMEIKGIKAEKEKLNHELSKEKNEVEQWESQASRLFGDLQVLVVHETFLKGLTYELGEAYNNLESRSTLKDEEIDQLNQRLSKEKNEVELWESQASTLFGDLQILSVQKTLLEGLIHELAEACNNHEKRSTYKDVEINQLKGRVNNLEDANKGQDDLMSKYAQATILLKESIESLEKHIAMPHELEDEPAKDIASRVDNNEGLVELQEMCLRIKAIEEALTKKLAVEELKTASRRSRRRNGSLRKQNHEIYSQESEMITKDIVLDQVSDCSSYGISKRDILKIEDDHNFEVQPQSQTGKSLSEESLVVDKLEISDRFTDPNKEVNKRKVLERLHSDLQKLSNLHIAVEDLKSKVEKEERSEKGKEDEYETVKGQIHEAEEALEKLLSVNRKLVTKVVSGFEISESSVDLDEDERSRRRISEQARRGSEKIGRLQFEIQRLQHLLLKLEGEREDRAKAKTSSDSKTRTLLKDYIYGGVRGERRKRLKKRFAFCGCVQQPPPSP